jgi:DNA-binding MarR family transcriptional regulator/GNAT superfamily N-acetyltransferase
MYDDKIAQIRLFNRYYTSVIGLLDRHYLKSDFSLTETRIMFELHHRPEGLTASALIELLNLDKGYLSRILQTFEKKKLIEKTRSDEDKRAFYIRLSRLGTTIFSKINNEAEQLTIEMLSSLSYAETNQLVDHMQAIRQLLNKSNIQNNMNNAVNLNAIVIRTELQSGDMGYITYMHGDLYKKEYGYGLSMEAYIADGFAEFYKNYDPQKDRVWVAEYKGRIAGFLLLMHRESNAAQLRYFILDPEFRGIGLGKKMAGLYLEYLKEKGYKSSYLWTTNELFTAAHIYKKMGFSLTEEFESTAFGKRVKEQRYDLVLEE